MLLFSELLLLADGYKPFQV